MRRRSLCPHPVVISWPAWQAPVCLRPCRIERTQTLLARSTLRSTCPPSMCRCTKAIRLCVPAAPPLPGATMRGWRSRTLQPLASPAFSCERRPSTRFPTRTLCATFSPSTSSRSLHCPVGRDRSIRPFAARSLRRTSSTRITCTKLAACICRSSPVQPSPRRPSRPPS